MIWTDAQSEVRLAQAFADLFDHLVKALVRGAPTTDAPEFSYLMTPKQLATVQGICAAKGWPVVNCRGIHIDAQAVMHPLSARLKKDSVKVEDVKSILLKAYSPRSLICENRDHTQQTLIFNTHHKLLIGTTKYHGMAVLEVKSTGARNYLAPVTAYHATEAKVRALQKR